MSEVSKEESDIISKIEATLTKAEERVLYPQANGVKAKICGKDVELRPLPIFYAKKIGNRIQYLVNLINGSEEEKNKWKTEANNLVADAFVDCLLAVCEFYELGVDSDKVQKMMTIPEVKAIVTAQAQLNEESDFLLQPLHIITMLISGAEAGIKNAKRTIDTSELEESLVSSRPTVKPGESDILN